MSTTVKIINFGPQAVEVSTASDAGEKYTTEVVYPQQVSKTIGYVYPGQRIVVEEVKPKE